MSDLIFSSLSYRIRSRQLAHHRFYSSKIIFAKIINEPRQRLAGGARHAGVHLHGNRNFRVGKIHHLGEIARKETAMAVARAEWCLADDDAESVCRIRTELGGNAVAEKP